MLLPCGQLHAEGRNFLGCCSCRRRVRVSSVSWYSLYQRCIVAKERSHSIMGTVPTRSYERRLMLLLHCSYPGICLLLESQQTLLMFRSLAGEMLLNNLFVSRFHPANMRPSLLLQHRLLSHSSGTRCLLLGEVRPQRVKLLLVQLLHCLCARHQIPVLLRQRLFVRKQRLGLGEPIFVITQLAPPSHELQVCHFQLVVQHQLGGRLCCGAL